MNNEKINILAVDDKPENLKTLEAILNNPGYRILTATNGREALGSLLKHEVALILLDVHMPVMDGFETAEFIRKRDKTKYTPIIFVTAEYNDFFHLEKGYALGAVDYLIKPIVPAFLKAKVDVFVELFRKTEKIKQQEIIKRQEKLRREQEERKRKELESTLAGMRAMTGYDKGAADGEMERIGPLRDRHPQRFETLQSEYVNLLDDYLAAKTANETLPNKAAAELAKRIGNLWGGPRDVVDIHLRAVMTEAENQTPERVQAHTIEGRLLVLEVMGNLADYYRLEKCFQNRER